jgi:hypothetical protein
MRANGLFVATQKLSLKVITEDWLKDERNQQMSTSGGGLEPGSPKDEVKLDS